MLAITSLALAGDCGSSTSKSAIKTASNSMESKMSMDIVETAVSAGSFNTLATALTEAGLVQTLKGEGPFTVFAPNDAAFGKIPNETLSGLLKDKSGLTSVLTYHVVPGKVMASDVVKMNGQKVKTVNGKELTITVVDGTVYADGAQVIATDVTASNGVIHVIDSVVMPK
jgi:uncharacterized surface protein with fasciclin (FAS1) repeats